MGELSLCTSISNNIKITKKPSYNCMKKSNGKTKQRLKRRGKLKERRFVVLVFKTLNQLTMHRDRLAQRLYNISSMPNNANNVTSFTP